MTDEDVANLFHERLGPKTGLKREIFFGVARGLHAHQEIRAAARAFGQPVPMSDARMVHAMLTLAGAEIEIDDVIRAMCHVSYGM